MINNLQSGSTSRAKMKLTWNIWGKKTVQQNKKLKQAKSKEMQHKNMANMSMEN